ncbi:MAG: 1-phosphofructokinase family hexose kinase [Bacillota bacterium]|jgi:1-phosphofructokinase|nr:1-phosphofructokinase family hexose kinase [Bacillota bacterium]NLL25990.1 1-phosphofructokinase family hexose kinase [Erysipelotrichia bacterium]
MIVTITLNPAIDYHVYVADLKRDKTNVMAKKEICCGGKGINVNKALSLLKENSVATGFLFSNDSSLFENELNDKYIVSDFVTIEGSTRTNIKINDQNGNLIEINENNQVEKKDFIKLMKKIDKYLIKDNIIVISGSLPKGLSEDSYLKLCLKAKEKGCQVILDSSKKSLALAYEYCDVIKPNKEEFVSITDLEFDCSTEDIIDKLKEFNNEIVAVSLGEQGAIYKYKKDIYKVKPLALKIKSTVGAGDAMVAGISYGIKNKKNIEDIIRYSSALASLIITDFDRDSFECKLEKLKTELEIERL